MVKKLIAVLTAGVVALSLAACGSSKTADKTAASYGVITGTSASSAVSDLLLGVQSFADQQSVTVKTYKAEKSSSSAYVKALKKAANADPTFVIADGTDLEVPVYEAAKAEPGADFVLFDGVTRKAEGGDDSIPDNVVCVHFNEEDVGYIAGYAAVSAGYRKIGYMTQESKDSENEYFTGFVQGCERAAMENGLSSKGVMISIIFEESDLLTPLRMTDANNLYADGDTLIVTDGENLSKAIESSASLAGTYVADIGFDRTGSSDSVLFASVTDRNQGAVAVLGSLTTNGFKGGSVINVGAAQGAVSLSTDYARMGSFSQDALNTIISSMAAGSITLDYAKDAQQLTSKGKNTGLNSVSEGNAQVSVEVVSPVTPDPEAETDLAADSSAESAADSSDEETVSSGTSGTAKGNAASESSSGTDSTGSEIAAQEVTPSAR